MVVDWLKQYWFIFSALLLVGVAWGQNTSKVIELEKTVVTVVKKQDKLEKLVADQSRLDERTVNIQAEQKEQRALLMQLIIGQRAIARSVDTSVVRSIEKKDKNAPKD